MDEANSYLCGYLMIKGLTDDFPTLTTFFHGEIISAKHPFLTRKWEADEEIDRYVLSLSYHSKIFTLSFSLENIGTSLKASKSMLKTSTTTLLIISYLTKRITCS